MPAHNFLHKFLRYLERYTKTDMVYLVGQSSWLLLGQGAVFASSFLMAWVFANHIDPSDYGIYKYVVSIAAIAAITTMTGLSIALSRSVTQGYNVHILRLLRVRFLYGLLGTLGVFGIALYYWYLENTLLASLFAITALFVPFYETLSDYQFFLQGKKDFKTQTYTRIFQRLLLTFLVIGAIILTDSILVITLVFFAASVISHSLALLYTIRTYPPGNDSNTPYEAISKQGKHISGQNIFFIAAGQLDKVLLFKFLGPTQLATYLFALAIPQEINGLLGNVNSVAFPKLVDQTSIEFRRSLLKKIGIFTFFLFIPIIGYILVAPYLFTWFFPRYTDAIFASQLFIGTVLFIPASLIWHYFYATHNNTALWYASIIGPSVYLSSIVLLTPTYGIIGAVLAWYVRGIVDIFTSLFFLFRDHPAKPKESAG